MFDFRTFRWLDRAKLHIFSTLSFLAFCFLVIFADSFLSNFSLQSLAIKTNNGQLDIKTGSSTRQVLESVIVDVPIRQSPQEEISETENCAKGYDNMVPPMNITKEKRIDWFKEKLPEFEIFKSTPRSMEFENRVVDFFGDDHCKTQFFMTWIFPASSFGERELLAVESLFKAHPHGCLMILSKTMDSDCGLNTLTPIINHGFKVVSITPDLNSLFNNTPAELWFDDMKNGKKDPGEIPLAQNLSNLMRLAILYKYGGVYMDTDFIILKDFSGLRNSIGAQSMNKFGKWTRLNNAVLVFDKDHPLLYKFMEEFASSFDGNKWGHNGPYLVSRVVSKFSAEKDYNLTVLPPMAFYPVYWNRVETFFIRPVNHDSLRWVEAKLLQLRGETFGIHLWNKQSSRLRIEEGSIIERLISDHCIICKHIYSS